MTYLILPTPKETPLRRLSPLQLSSQVWLAKRTTRFTTVGTICKRLKNVETVSMCSNQTQFVTNLIPFVVTIHSQHQPKISQGIAQYQNPPKPKRGNRPDSSETHWTRIGSTHSRPESVAIHRNRLAKPRTVAGYTWDRFAGIRSRVGKDSLLVEP